MSSDLSEGERESTHADSMPRVESNLALSISNADDAGASDKEKPVKDKYIVLLSLHGLVRGDNMELGRDSDTGGQVKYVVEFARSLALMPDVYRVDLFTRQICSPDVDWSYGEPTEMLGMGTYNDSEEVGESSGAYIVRIPFGPRDQYLRKELLWPHIPEFVDGALAHIRNMSKVLGDQIHGKGGLIWPYAVHGHYADAGDAAALLSGALNVPMVLTGHSLGRNKLEQLLKQGRESRQDINTTYRIMRRIEGEELSLDSAELVITSTKQEIEEQWGLYDGFDVKLERVLRARARRGVSCHGRYMPRMVVIPPGMDFSNVIVQEAGDIVEGEAEAVMLTSVDASNIVPITPRDNPPIWEEIMRFFSNPHKPMILALARPDPKKNLTTLLKAFGERQALRELANLTLIMGNRDDIDEMSGGNAAVMTTVLKLIDKYDLYGQVAYPKHHKQCDVPEIYRLAAKTKGVFVNPALVEPFGLTLIEAAAHGLPMVATKNGGPVDIHKTLSNGLLVDPHNEKEIADALLKLLSERNLWSVCRKNGLKNIHLYSWPEHCRKYLSWVALCRMRHPQWKTESSLENEELIESQSDSLRDVQDISLRLSVDGNTSISNPGDLERLLRSQNSLGKSNGKDDVKVNLGAKQRAVNSSMDSTQDEGTDARKTGSLSTGAYKAMPLKKRRRLVIIAVDGYDLTSNKPSATFVTHIQSIVKAIQSDSSIRVQPGLIISSALTMSEIVEMLNSAGMSPMEFDALICSSGSEVYYPASGSDDGGTQQDLQADKDYSSHIDYRWGYEGLRKTMARLNTSDAASANNDKIWIEDTGSCNSHCLAYTITNPDITPNVDQLRQRLRMRGLRCHAMYCRNATRLHLLPLSASRSQALRYFFIRWNVDVSNMIVVVGETGDSDYEELLSGTHKTILIRGAVEGGSERKLRASGNYDRVDVAPSESPNMVVAEANSVPAILLEALKQ
ncbi:hypothetical protein M758_10G176100 [Ceratodon purpureus]|nr:hypothetical protein KC19_10G180500 [Ceratodon purpureus]KAG0604495.1 hypothetical protein M758_10G176100 [Ceratodon purpureus]